MLHAYLITFCVSLIAVLILHRLAKPLGLLDRPCLRKAHEGHVPLVGGMAVFIAASLGMFIFFGPSKLLNLFIISCSLMVFIGVLDDKYDLSVRSRLIGQFLVSSILIFGLDTYIFSLGNVFYFMNFELGVFGVIFTYLAVIGAINAFNMVDGIDGLLGGLSIVSFTGIAILSYNSSSDVLLMFSTILIISILPYLMANLSIAPFKNKKVFMGDAGSMFIGLAVVWLVVFGTQQTFVDGPSFRPVTALYLIALPLMDMVAIMFRRIKKKQSPFKPDRNHMHHICMRAGFSGKQSLCILCLVATFIMAIGVFLELMHVPEWMSLLIFIILFALYNYCMSHVWRIVKYIRKHSQGEIKVG